MFCMNCGEKLFEGAKFCPNCGTKLVAMLEQEQDKKLVMATTPLLNTNKQNIKNTTPTKEQMIEAIFFSIFHIRGEFGSRIYLTGKDKIMPEDEADIMNYFLFENHTEKLLMFFEYEKNHINKGFVITNQRIAWDYGRGISEILLVDIKKVEIGKSLLATVMKLTSYRNETYPEILLTWIDGEAEFVTKFRKFIDTIHKELYGDSGNNQTSNRDTDFIVRSCNSLKISDAYCEVGNPKILQSSKRYQKAKLYFNIPDNEDIFFIYDNTVLGSCKTGFALCTTGFYYCIKQNRYIPWEEFVFVNISKCFCGIKIGEEEFTMGGEANKLITILKSIQEYFQ